MFWNEPIMYGYKDVNFPQVPFMNQLLYNRFVPPYGVLPQLDINRMQLPWLHAHQIPQIPLMNLPFMHMHQIPQVPFQGNLPFMHMHQIPQVPFQGNLPFMHMHQIPQVPFQANLPWFQVPQVNLPHFHGFYRPFIY